MTMAINLLLAAAECEIIADADVQRAALRAVINCVCAPINRVRFSLLYFPFIFFYIFTLMRLIFANYFKVGGNVARYSVTGSTKKKANMHNSEELIQKVWESIRSNNGIMVCLCVYNYVL